MDETLEHAAADRAVAAPQLSPGTTIGHFRIVRELGAGGMGIVFEAYDPDLDRNVAIKVVRDRDAGSAAGERLVREAQAMARLGHPNVVPVHEVGTIDGQVFVVMELVRGTTLATWLETKRSWREIVRAFEAAGEGLAAAHAAGLVHRDFKPSNVLVDGAGHVRVSDFGLARDDAAEPAAGPRFAQGTDPTRPAGTPAYMAPEQKAGEQVDARADQYSFAISLDRALDSAVGSPPRRVRAALARALSVDPDARFEALDDLIEELQLALDARRRKILALTTGLAVAAATTAIAAWVMRPAGDDCAEGAKLVDALWSAQARDAQAARFATVRPGEAAQTASVARVLDEWTDAWRLGRRAACRAEPAQRPARLSCLDRDLGALRAQLAVWASADGEAVDRSLSSASGLPDPALCATRTGAAETPAVRALQDRIAAVHAEDRAGHSAAARTKLDTLLGDAKASGDAAAYGGALLVAAEIEHSTGALAAAHDHAASAAREAGRGGDDDVLFRALIAESAITIDLGRARDSLGILDAAEAVAERAHLDRADRIASFRGAALTQSGQLHDAIPELTRAVALVEARAARTPAAKADLAAVLGGLASAYSQSYEYAKARDLLLRTQALEEAALGPNHPELGKTLHDLADDDARLGDFDDAFALDRRARQIFADAYGENHALVVTVDLSVAGITLQSKGDDAAQPLFERARDELAKFESSDHPDFATIEEALGSIERDRDKCKDAIPHFARALAITEHAGKTGPQHAMDLTNLGACLSDAGRKSEAKPMIERALAEYTAASVPDADLCEDLGLLAEIEYDEGNRAKAIAMVKHVTEVLTPLAKQMPYSELYSYEKELLAKWTRAKP